MGDREVATFSWLVRKGTIQDETAKSHGVSFQHCPGPTALKSRRNSKSKGIEVGVCPAFIKK